MEGWGRVQKNIAFPDARGKKVSLSPFFLLSWPFLPFLLSLSLSFCRCHPPQLDAPPSSPSSLSPSRMFSERSSSSLLFSFLSPPRRRLPRAHSTSPTFIIHLGNLGWLVGWSRQGDNSLRGGGGAEGRFLLSSSFLGRRRRRRKTFPLLLLLRQTNLPPPPPLLLPSPPFSLPLFLLSLPFLSPRR